MLAATVLPGWCVPAPPAQSLYSFSLIKPGGQVVPLSEYKGKVVVIVNLASKSSFADQLPALEKLAEQYKDQGLVILGIPSNDFGAEEPGDDAEIQKFYAGEHVSFPVMAKSTVCGKDALPVYGFLTAAGKGAKTKEPPPPNDVHWSFTKFIVTRDGQVGARFEPGVAPDSPEFEIAIDQALAGKLKPKSSPAAGAVEGGGDDDDDGGL
jgi:glutathione peroxidase